MHDIRAIREQPQAFDAALARRGLDPCSAQIMQLDAELRASIAQRQQAETDRNLASRQIGQAKAQGDEAKFAELKNQAAKARAIMENAKASEVKTRELLETLLSGLPNSVLSDIPDGQDESDNRQLRQWGKRPDFAFEIAHHADLGGAIKTPRGDPCMDFEAGAKLSGARFVGLRGVLAKLERVLTQFMLNMHINTHGYEEIAPPFLVRPEALYGTGQLPKFGEDLFGCHSGHYAIPTAEVPLTNLVRDQILPAKALPMRLCAATPCFRAEAGAAGRDTRGLIRLHQFLKVELVSIIAPDCANDELDRMTACAEAVLQALNLPYRVMELCAGDIGFSARRTYDLEVWMPSENRYREISSCSDCGDFQARRMKARYRQKAESGPAFLHTLNGSALAVGRTLAALLENGQQSDGSILLPEVLADLMGADRLGGEAN